MLCGAGQVLSGEYILGSVKDLYFGLRDSHVTMTKLHVTDKAGGERRCDVPRGLCNTRGRKYHLKNAIPSHSARPFPLVPCSSLLSNKQHLVSTRPSQAILQQHGALCTLDPHQGQDS